MTKWGKTLSSHAWDGIPTPKGAEGVMARRVDSDLEWKFYWARDPEQRFAWLMSVGRDSLPQGPAPNLRGVEVRVMSNESDLEGTLSLTLLDVASKDLFYRLCNDVMLCTAGSANEREAASAALSRTWRWHHMLRGAGTGLLSEEAQKGLIGELHLLETLAIPIMGARGAVHAWVGPLDAPKDFEIGRTAVEVKARRGTANPYVSISSAPQMDESGCDDFFLAVVEVANGVASSQAGTTLAELVDRVRNAMVKTDPAAIEEFENRLNAAGFRDGDDYTDFRWIVGPQAFYRVEGDFPRITGSQVPASISNLTYRIALSALTSFAVPAELVASTIGDS